MEPLGHAPGETSGLSPQPASPRLHSFIALKPAKPPSTSTSSSARHAPCVLSPTKPTRHLSPRKFHELQQQQRQAVLRSMMPLLSPLQQRATPRDPVPWNPAWLTFPVDAIPTVTAKGIGGASLSLGAASLDAWLEAFDRDVLQFESLEAFVQVKLPEALAFCEKMEGQIEEMEERERAEDEAKQAGSAPTSSAQRRGFRRGGGRLWRRPRHATSAMTRFPVRFRVAVFASVVERAVVAMTQSAALAHLKPWLLQARQELFRAVFADYDQWTGQRKATPQQAEPTGPSEPGSEQGDNDEDDNDDESNESSDAESDPQQQRKRRCRRPPPQGTPVELRYGPDAPRPLSFFLSRVPYLLKLQDDSQRRTTRFQRHQVVLRRIVQSLYRSLGSVFHAWKMYTRQRREERLNDKGAQLTAMVVIQRGLVRTIFVEWSKCALKTKLQRAQAREAHTKRVHDDRVNELYKELFLLREQNARLERELQQAKLGACGQVQEEEEDENDQLGDA